MKRRNFLLSSMLAAGTAGAGLAGSEQTDSAGGKAREYYELRRYQLKSGPQIKGIHAFLEEALIPGLNRLGMKPIGVFSLDFDTGATTFVADTRMTVTSGAFELATFDPVGRRYFQTLDSSTYYVVAVDLRTRNVTRLNNALYDDQFDPGPAPALAVPALDVRFLGALAALLALIGFWRTMR